jgi:hypothetical protein
VVPLQQFDEFALGFAAEVGLDDGRVVGLDRLDHPVDGGVAGQEEHGRPARLQRLPDAPDQVVVDADGGERAAHRPGTRPDHRAPLAAPLAAGLTD